jgi:hypothetical protein
LKFHGVDFLCLICPVFLTLALLTSKGEETSEPKLSALIPNPDLFLMMPYQALKKSHLLVKHNRRKRESQIRVPEMQSAFHPHAQRSLTAAMRVSNPDRSPVGINR